MNQANPINPLVTVVVTTRNNSATLDACLASIKHQTYQPIELVVVDNYSNDGTQAIAQRYTDRVFTKGPERCTQRNFAVQHASGTYIAIIDSDMELSERVIAACVAKIQSSPNIKGVIIPEESFGVGFWAQCKRLERSFYVGVEWIEAARFFDKAVYEQLGGYNEALVSGEDWDLSQRVREQGELARIDEFIFHNEGKLKLANTLKKKYYYAQKFTAYLKANQNAAAAKIQTGPLTRYKLFFGRPIKLFRNPLHGLGMLFMKTCEFGIGAIGYARASRKEQA